MKNILDYIGNTPLVELSNIVSKYNLKARIFAKVEMFNPSGSIKIRPAYQMIEDALKQGVINNESIIIEPTSGNMGVALALVCSVKRMKFIAIMPENMSKERIQLIKAYGGEIILTPKEKGMQGSVDKAISLAKSSRNAFIPSQFNNPSNPKSHYLNTSKEILNEVPDIDYLVASFGTGGTISGIGTYLKNYSKKVKIVGVEPSSSPLISKGIKGPHKIQGIGANFVPENLNTKIIDQIILVTDEDAFKYSRELAVNEGLFVGISSGAALFAAIELAKQEENRNKNIVVILPDTGERYLSMNIVED